MNRAFRPMLLALTMVVAMTAQVNAALITFTHTGEVVTAAMTGTVGGTPFATPQFTITATGDTTARQSAGPNVFFIDHTTASIDIVGVGTFDFISPTRTFFNDAVNVVGFSRGGGGGGDLYNGPASATLDGWDMLTSIGPVAGTGSLIQWADAPQINTSGGILIFNDRVASSATFTAVVAADAVPEPATLTMFGLGALGFVGGALRRRFRKVA
jgi:hypothetical protein